MAGNNLFLVCQLFSVVSPILILISSHLNCNLLENFLVSLGSGFEVGFVNGNI